MDNKGRKRRWNKLLLLLVLVLSLLGGCTSTNGGNASRLNNSPNGTESVTLKLVQSLPNDIRTKSLKALIQNFEQQHPGITVVLVPTDYATADKKIMSLLNEEHGTDIVEVRTGNLQTFIAGGLITSLESYINGWHEYRLLNENARLAATDLNGTPYYIPNGLYQSQLYYRKDLFDAKALQVPETWEQLYFVGKQLTSPSRNQFGFAFRGGTGATRVLNQIIQDYNSDEVNLSEPMYRHDGQTIFAYGGALEAVELYRRLYADISPPESIAWGLDQQVDAFASGMTAMLIQDSDAITLIEEQLKYGTWATAPLPAGPDGLSYYSIGGAGWGISANSKHKDKAWELISFLSSPDNHMKFAAETGIIPIYNDASDMEYLTSGAFAPYILMNNDPLRYAGTKSLGGFANNAVYTQEGPEMLRKYLRGDWTAEQLLSELDEMWRR
ncbi:ABC transporter substrate-binding protein [Paenibacillus harenae]|uniref:Multiple sugar transport system substrate-binding protein n=1 Tax=Paenibacillus harenae TaxID=306543 RepID=A0ABT9U1T4_PAEHA|nr:sugar ABC transporter substrate-binding protein [Paenibacillus harenae]MDQ0113523.1 multiple sugar transport system substrate-binding protein [Paenibacillus harenae]